MEARTLPMTDETVAWMCVPCSTRNRRTIKYADAPPEFPCSQGCQRIEWQPRSFFCIRCEREGHTTIAHCATWPTFECPRELDAHGVAWNETFTSRWAFEGVPYPTRKDA